MAKTKDPWDFIPTKRKKVLQRAYHELLIEFRMHQEHTLPKADQEAARAAGLSYDNWLDQWDRWIKWNIQQWMKAGDIDAASIKKRARELASIPSRFYMKAKPKHSAIDYQPLLDQFAADYGKPFGE